MAFGFRCLLKNSLNTAAGPNGHPNMIDQALNLIQFQSCGARYKSTREISREGCMKHPSDIPAKVEDHKCPIPCKKRKKQSILYRLKLKIMEGGSNFGTPFARLRATSQTKCVKEKEDKDKKSKDSTEEKSGALAIITKPESEVMPKPGAQVAILGVETMVGQYVALLLKQCPHLKKLQLYDASDPCQTGEPCGKNSYDIAKDLLHIDTSCRVQGYTSSCCELDQCLHGADIVLMLDSKYCNPEMSFECRFACQAPIVKKYADSISLVCPKAIIIVCATPIDCMVPLVAETMKETGMYDKRKLLGCMAVPEMRASTLAARALCLEPWYTKVPCIGGTEGDTLVPLFSKAIENFEFSKRNTEMLTAMVRERTTTVPKNVSDLSEAHAIAGMVKTVAHALVCQDRPWITGFVEADPKEIITPARYLGMEVQLNRLGIRQRIELPPKLSDYELKLIDNMWELLDCRVSMSDRWFRNCNLRARICRGRDSAKNFHVPKFEDSIQTCLSHTRDS